jgi:hypothetical protein
LLGLCLLLLGVLSAAAVQGADPREHPAAARFLVLGLLGWGALAAWASWHWRRSAQGRLMWRDGQWAWWADGQNAAQPLGAMGVVWDGQRVMLLRLEGDAATPRWAWLERRRDVARWDDLRRAVWAAQRTSLGGV